MSTRAATITIFSMIGLAFLVALFLYPQMPDPMPSHWNAAGEVDGYMAKSWGLFLMPLLAVGVFLLFLAIPKIDPLKANIAEFSRAYNLMMVLLIAYLLYIYALTLLWALGFQFNMTFMLLPAMGVLFIAIGYLVGKAKRNFFVGIRTPWTLSSDTVWAKTHQLGKWTFVGAGVVSILCAFLGGIGFWIFTVTLLAAALVPIIYSYILWRRENPA
jgi:uncharacterized membrane protein